MATPYVGEIKLVPYNFAPVGWEFCNGQILSIAEFTVLFELIGTTYGGDGVSTFALPDLRGRAAIHMTSNYPIGAQVGSESVVLQTSQIPPHAHELHVSGGPGDSNDPTGRFLCATSTKTLGKPYSDSTNAKMNSGSVGVSGNGQPHDNMQPYLVMNYIISLFGIVPSQG